MDHEFRRSLVDFSRKDRRVVGCQERDGIVKAEQAKGLTLERNEGGREEGGGGEEEEEGGGEEEEEEDDDDDDYDDDDCVRRCNRGVQRAQGCPALAEPCR